MYLEFVKLSEINFLEIESIEGNNNTKEEEFFKHLWVIFDHHSGTFLQIEDSQELIVLDTELEKLGVRGFNLDCSLNPNANSEEIKSFLTKFSRFYLSRN